MQNDLPLAYGAPVGRGRFRVEPEDFVVVELPLVEPSGAGEHAWLYVRKRNQNTAWVADQLARFAGIRPRDVSYAGLKDRYAVTEQWFSLHLPGTPDPDWSAFTCDGVEIVYAHRHDRKLRRGTLKGNRFQVRLREFDGDLTDVEARLQRLEMEGMPNYFGEQRFGRDNGNLAAVREMFADPRRRIPKHKRGLYLSAARSHLFNRVLGERVRQDTWHRCLPGDLMQLDGKRALFAVEQCDEEIQTRLEALDIHPTGPLWGRGRSSAKQACARLEEKCLAEDEDLCLGLEQAGVEMARRALRVRIEDISLRYEDDDLSLQFSLPAGSYATVLLEQLVELRPADAPG